MFLFCTRYMVIHVATACAMAQNVHHYHHHRYTCAFESFGWHHNHIVTKAYRNISG